MRKAIAIDFDGCLCIDAAPEIGDPNWAVINRAKAEQRAGAGLILWTCREGQMLQDALAACEEWGLTFDAVNESLPDWIEAYGNNPRKVGASEYWDDKAVRMEDNPPLGLEHLRELARAEKDGRLVVLPCKVGDTLYIISHGIIDETKVRTFFLGHPSHNVEKRNMRMMRTTNWDISMDEICKTVFLTHEEAEAALKKREEEGNEPD